MTRTLWLTLACGMVLALIAVACGDDATPAGDAGSDSEVLAAVTHALETKNGWAVGSATVTLDGVVDGRFAHGGVRDATGSGALWFASLVDGSWQIVWDGNGIPECATLEPYADYPASLLTQCTDAGGSLQARQ